MKKSDLELYKKYRKSPIFFIDKMWGLTPQPLRKKYRGVETVIPLKDIKKEWFEPFIKGKHIAWQQWVILLAVERSLLGIAQRRISVRSGHGIGKSASLAWLLLWFLFCFKDAQVPCTAPGQEQMYDILWKEVKKWLNRMTEAVQEKYEWQSKHVRMTESPETWFARAKTARKEAPEALAGVHGEHVMFLVDEASGVPEEIYETAEGALTSGNILFIMISNATRDIGYFYESHHADKADWQNLAFNAEDSPIVDRKFVSRIIKKYGKGSDEHRIRVKGKFARAGAIDDKGYSPILTTKQIVYTRADKFVGDKKLGVDPAGEGDNRTVWVVRDRFMAKIVAEEEISDPKGIAKKTMTLMTKFDILPAQVWIDLFGEGAKTVQELALARQAVNGVDVSNKANDSSRFLNKRAESYFGIRAWIRSGGLLFTSKEWRELRTIKFIRTLSGLIKIMSKKEMRKEGIKSPDYADALMLTFYESDDEEEDLNYIQKAIKRGQEDRKAKTNTFI